MISNTLFGTYTTNVEQTTSGKLHLKSDWVFRKNRDLSEWSRKNAVTGDMAESVLLKNPKKLSFCKESSSALDQKRFKCAAGTSQCVFSLTALNVPKEKANEDADSQKKSNETPPIACGGNRAKSRFRIAAALVVNR